MDCIEFRKIFILHVEGRVSRGEAREVRLHREACPCCDRRARYEERFQAVLREHLAPLAAPVGLRDRIRARLAREGRRGPDRGAGNGKEIDPASGGPPRGGGP